MYNVCINPEQIKYQGFLQYLFSVLFKKSRNPMVIW